MTRTLHALFELALSIYTYPAGIQGQTYFVDLSGSDDTGNGSLGAPWRIIVYAATQLIAGDHLIHLTWSVDTPLPLTSAWQVAYEGPSSDEPSPIIGITNPARAYTPTA
ncbi:MAG: hypothetical protein PVF74_00195 [Anaerolineales bacterium]|jgi:hypothetical protein